MCLFTKRSYNLINREPQFAFSCGETNAEYPASIAAD